MHIHRLLDARLPDGAIRPRHQHDAHDASFGDLALMIETIAAQDIDGDGKCDIAIWRPATSAVWYIYQSSNAQTRTANWGTTDDIPVSVFYRR